MVSVWKFAMPPPLPPLPEMPASPPKLPPTKPGDPRLPDAPDPVELAEMAELAIVVVPKLAMPAPSPPAPPGHGDWICGVQFTWVAPGLVRFPVTITRLRASVPPSFSMPPPGSPFTGSFVPHANAQV